MKRSVSADIRVLGTASEMVIPAAMIAIVKNGRKPMSSLNYISRKARERREAYDGRVKDRRKLAKLPRYKLIEKLREAEYSEDLIKEALVRLLNAL